MGFLPDLEIKFESDKYMEAIIGNFARLDEFIATTVSCSTKMAPIRLADVP